MYVILVYDVEAGRTTRMLKACRRYLHWIQNSVFEGELRESQLKTLLSELEAIMDQEYDSVIVFSSGVVRRMQKQVLGTERNPVDNFL